MMKKALVSQCNDNEVRLAKDILWGVYGEELLGKPLKRNHVPDNPSAHCEKQVKDIQGVTTTHSGQIKTVIADIGKMKIDMMSNPAEVQTISQTLLGVSWNNSPQFPSLPYVPTGKGALARLSLCISFGFQNYNPEEKEKICVLNYCIPYTKY